MNFEMSAYKALDMPSMLAFVVYVVELVNGILNVPCGVIFTLIIVT